MTRPTAALPLPVGCDCMGSGLVASPAPDDTAPPWPMTPDEQEQERPRPPRPIGTRESDARYVAGMVAVHVKRSGRLHALTPGNAAQVLSGASTSPPSARPLPDTDRTPLASPAGAGSVL